MITMNLNIDGIEARSRDEATAAAHGLATETLSRAVGFDLDDLVVTSERIEPIGGDVTRVPIKWHAHLTVRPHF
jgi:hypothetical protein